MPQFRGKIHCGLWKGSSIAGGLAVCAGIKMKFT